MGMNVALLRAVNLAGKNAVSMADLRELFTDAGLEDVQTLLQSGNVVFRGKTTEQSLAKEAQKRMGVAIEFFVRSAKEWDAIIGGNPFPREAKDDPAHLLVLTLKSAGPGGPVDWPGPEILRVDGRTAYAFYPNGVGRSKLTNAIIEKKLGTRVTGRNWNTVLKIQAALRASP